MYFPQRGVVKQAIGKKIWWGVSAEMERERESKDGLDFGVQGNMGDGLAADEEPCPSSIGEMEKAADVVILVVTREEALRLGGGKAEGGKSHGLAKITGMKTIETDEFPQRHEGCAASSFGANGLLLKPSVLPHKNEEKRLTRRRSPVRLEQAEQARHTE